MKEELELEIQNIKMNKLLQAREMQREDLMELEKIGVTMESTEVPAEGEYKDYFFEIDEDYKVTIIGKLKGEKPSIQAEITTTGLVVKGNTVEIKVTASINEGSIQSIEVPDTVALKTDISATEKIYVVTANGTYYFKAKADNGRSARAKVEVNTILESPEISIKDKTDKEFTIVVNNNYPEGLITEYRYYVNGELKLSGTTSKEHVFNELPIGQHEIYVEAYIGENQLTSNTVMGTISMDVAELKAGDYIKYNSGANGIITCRVLYPVSSQYGLQIISNKTVKDVTLVAVGSTWETGKKAYNNAIVTLNNAAEAYINTEYAQDARCVGSKPTVNASGTMTQKDQGATTTVSVYGYSGFYSTDTNYTTDQSQMSSAGILNIGQSYWLASRYIYYGYGYGYSDVRIMFSTNVSTSANLSSRTMCHTYQDGTKYGYTYSNPCSDGLRPCISLKSNIVKIIGGDGKSEGTAYILAK